MKRMVAAVVSLGLFSSVAFAQSLEKFVVSGPDDTVQGQDREEAERLRQERMKKFREELRKRFQDPDLSDLAAGRSSLGASAAKVPGNYGPNAYPIPPLDDPRVGDDILIRNGMGFQLDRGSDRSLTWDTGIAIPFARMVELRIDTQPVEAWKLGRESQDLWGIEESEGVGATDILVGTKFNMLQETEDRPALSVSVITRTATSSTEYRRGFDSAGYGFLLTGGKRWTVDPDNFLCVERVGLDAGVGFLAVDANKDPTGVQQSGQNDYGWAAMKLSCYTEKSVTSVGARTELGWFREGDQLVEMNCSYTRSWSSNLSWYVEFTCGLTEDAPDFTASAGMILHLKSPWSKPRY